ncbi:MAG: stalk domain-containing protein [Oscillospiraceae bacterium]|nr:stalk domain-containing protein [Oscillospiraceae bacterium]
MRNKKIQILFAAVAVIMLLPFLCFNVYAEEAVVEKIGTIDIPKDNCYMDNTNIMIPFRLFWETFGAAVGWDNEQKTAKVAYESETCEFEINVFIGKKFETEDIWDKDINPDITASVGGESIFVQYDFPAAADMAVVVGGNVFPIFFDVPAEIKDGRIYTSINVLTDMFGAAVIYDWNTISFKFTDENILETAQKETEITGIIKLINEARTENGLKPLKQAMQLNKVCSAKAKDKAYYKYSGHISPKFGAPAEMVGKMAESYRFTGECLYYCSVKVPYERVFEAWMNSLGHRNIIMSESPQYIGINRFTDEKGGVYWALLTAK